MRFFRTLTFLAFLIFLSCSQQEYADLILHNAKIVTLDEAAPEVEAIAIKGDRILALGTNAEIKGLANAATKSIDLNGALAIPGLIDAHAHLMNLGRLRLNLDLSSAKTWDEAVELVGAAARDREPGSWILGRGWHQEKWTELPAETVDGYPLHHTLSDLTPDNPVFLTNSNGHAAFVNAKAMELVGITAETSDPAGGQILRDASGNATGVFLEEAETLFYPALEAEKQQNPEAYKRREIRVVELATAECLSKGITSLHEAGMLWETIDLLKELAEKGDLPIRVWGMISSSNEQFPQKAASYKMHRVGGDKLTVSGVKAYMDGALGSRGAWLLKPYTDLPSSSGIPTVSVDSLQKIANVAAENELQLCTHAIGDRGNREVLDVYEATFKSFPDAAKKQWRIEHAQHLHPEDIPRFAKLGVTASMQGVHCTSDAPWVPKRLGDERAESGAYVWRRLLDSGALVVNGTDAPVEDIDPLANFYSSVTRKPAGEPPFYPAQSMSRMEALRSYTIDAAKSVFEDDIKGSLSVGKLADITILSQDILTVSDEALLNTKVLHTIVGGEILFSHDKE